MKGFTLVELLVVVAVSILMTGGGMTAYGKYQLREKVNSTTNEIVSYINLARNMAVTNQVTDNFSEGLDYVAVVIGNGNMSASPVNVMVGVGPSAYFTKVLTTEGVTISPINFGDLQFAANTGRLLTKDPLSFSAYPVSAGSTKAISIEFGSNKKIISIDSMGVIKYEK